MFRRSAFLLLAALMLLAPLAALADSCTDCLRADSAKCCSASGCSCCVPGASALAASPWKALTPARSGVALDALEGGCLSVNPRDVFHVPKTSV
jgi:hypothetical protein